MTHSGRIFSVVSVLMLMVGCAQQELGNDVTAQLFGTQNEYVRDVQRIPTLTSYSPYTYPGFSVQTHFDPSVLVAREYVAPQGNKGITEPEVEMNPARLATAKSNVEMVLFHDPDGAIHRVGHALGR